MTPHSPPFKTLAPRSISKTRDPTQHDGKSNQPWVHIVDVLTTKNFFLGESKLKIEFSSANFDFEFTNFREIYSLFFWFYSRYKAIL